MDKEKEAIIDKIYINIKKIYSLLDLSNKPNNNSIKNQNSNQKGKEELNNTEAICSLVIYFFSDFKYKLQQASFTKKNEDNIISYLNQILSMTNSKFIITKSLSKTDLITLTLYIIHEYDFLASFVTHLKKYESKHLNVSLELISRKVAFQSNHSLKENSFSDILSLSQTSHSAIEAFNKLNFILKNIKKQIDLFVNLTYKVQELKRTQDKPISSLKIEEIIVVTDKVFNEYYESFQLTKETLIYYLESFPSLIETIDLSLELYQNSYVMFNVVNINPSYDLHNKNIKINTIKQLFQIKILLETQSNNSQSIMLSLNNWIQKMDDILSSNLASLKQFNPQLFNKNNVTQTLESIAGELENFIEANEKSIDKLMNAFDKDASNNNYSLIKMLACSNKDSLEEVYDNYLILNDGLEDIYNYYTDYVNEEVQSYTIDIKNKYTIMNNTP